MTPEAGRIHDLLTRVVTRRLEESLAEVEAELARWRRGEAEMMTAHSEALRHAARATRLSARVARAQLDGPGALLRDAHDLGFVDAEEFRRLVGKEVAEVTPLPALGAADEDGDGDGDGAAGGGAVEPPMPNKRTVLDALLRDGPVLLHVDARRADADVPDRHKQDARLVLRVGYGLVPPIPDFSFDEAGVVATLTFRGTPHRCVIAWESVYALVADDGRGLVWPESVPPEVARDLRPDGPVSLTDKEADAEPVVGTGATSAKRAVSPVLSPEHPKPNRSHLRLV